MLLAELVFSTEDVRELVFKRLDECDEEFVTFLEDKIAASTDLDERLAFRSLIEVIAKVKVAVEKRAVSAMLTVSLVNNRGIWALRRSTASDRAPAGGEGRGGELLVAVEYSWGMKESIVS